ncbi:hypothetical protein RCG23_05095 [Neobacillus sp. PS3-34]|uniref:hypothetical protein n=1 Tax=Neobacillus sp. PS3-34 TaxID=3070678 RepID=UPI0027E19A5D|nr:hypothetical protein [Neobacillus sp. PS3-34]WML49403.1 hypothetical protein RCG23_05095 [Neobacillus sp. PS3-34]
MKIYVVILLQFILWSGYTLTAWLSKHDQPVFNVIMFFIFFYLAFQIGNTITKSARQTLIVTAASLLLYCSFHAAMSLFSQ